MVSNINLATKTIFIHIPKTGGTSMSNVAWNKATYYDYYGHFSILDMQEFGVDIRTFFKWCFVRNPWERAISGFDHAIILKNKYITFDNYIKEVYKHKDYYSQLNYRWKGSLKGLTGLPPDAPKVFAYSQTSFITINNEICVDFIGRYENLQSDWLKLCNILKEKKPACIKKDNYFTKPEHFLLPHERNRRKDNNSQYIDKPYQEYYTKDTKNMVEEIYEKDIVNFNYKFE